MDIADRADLEIESRLLDAMRRHATRTSGLTGTACCRECGIEIPNRRRDLLPDTSTCVDCAEALELSGAMGRNTGAWWF